MFLLFGGNAYYPNGGWHDFKGVFDTVEDAMEEDDAYWDFMHVIDAETLKCVESRGGSCYISYGTVPGEVND